MKNKLIAILALLILTVYPPLALANNAQRQAFIEAYQILHQGGYYENDHLKDYVLYPYLEFERIKQHLEVTDTQTLRQFIKMNSPSRLSDNLTVDLIKRLAKQKQWRLLLTYYKEGKGGIISQCLGLEAQLRLNQQKTSQKILEKAMQVWLSGRSRPRECDALFSILKQKNMLTDEKAWQRITLAMKVGGTTLSRSLAKYTRDKALVNVWTKLRSKPETGLKHKRLQQKDTRTRQVIAYGIKRLARKNPNKARRYWNKFQKSHPFTLAEKSDVESYIGTREALNHNPYALAKLAAIPPRFRSKTGNEWLARLAIRQGDWNKALNAINAMQTDQQHKDIWQYWKAYAEKRSGRKLTVNLDKLAKNASFYGFLAADQRQLPYSRLLKKEFNWTPYTPKIKKIPAIQRATELFAVNMPAQAKKEWFWALTTLGKQDKLAAAAYALSIGQPYLAISTVSQTKDWNQTELRFPLEYRNLITQSARKQGIDPAWAYGITRRESAFDAQIVSSANAKGLMQVLPATAKVVARKLGLKNHRTSDLLIPEKNTLIGTGYLKQMLDRFAGNYVKATASYNAGPHRIPRWAPDFSVDAPRWIESIPFTETRNYVRAVMAYTTIYDFKLNHHKRRNLRLSQRLQKVGPE